MDTKILRLPAVMEATGLSRSLIYLYIKKGKFPKQVKLGERAAGWLEHEVGEWIASRSQSRGS